jgi:hypothetical protein
MLNKGAIMKITKEEFDKLYSDDITKKEYNGTINKINDRFLEIITTLVPDIKGWFDYGNCSYDSDISDGRFDINAYKETIYLGGEGYELPEPFIDYIPTKWLWEDFKSEFKKEVADYKEKIKIQKERAKKTAQARKEKRKILKVSIRKKLTKEELKVIKFKGG